jgi:Cu2+-exporting ATPase
MILNNMAGVLSGELVRPRRATLNQIIAQPVATPAQPHRNGSQNGYGAGNRGGHGYGNPNGAGAVDPDEQPGFFNRLMDRFAGLTQDGQGQELHPQMEKLQASIQILRKDLLPLLLGKERDQQLEEVLSDADKTAKRRANAVVDQNIRLASFSLGLAAAGALIYWPIGLLCIPTWLYSARRVFTMTYQSLKRGKTSTDLLVTITLIGAATSGYFVIGCLASLLFNLSFKVTNRVLDDSRKRLVDIFRQQPQTAWILIDGVEVEVGISEIAVGDTIIVNAGETIPIDGIIAQGLGTIDQHILTGESRPTEKGEGEEVFATTVLLSGKIFVQVEKTGNETTVAQIGQILNQTVEYKASVQLRAETLSDRTVTPTLLLGALAFPFLGAYGALAVINAHFKNLVTYSAPIGIMNFLNIAAQRGVLIKDGRTLDLLNKVDTIVFDKTGTLTETQPSIGQVHPTASYSVEEVLTYAAAAERNQSHPIAKAIREAAAARQLDLPEIETADYKLGFGLIVLIGGEEIRVGSHRFIEAADIPIPTHIAEMERVCHEDGHSMVLVSKGAELLGGIEIVPTVRPEAQSVINELRKKAGIKSFYIISGDDEAPTRKLAESLGVEHYFAQTLPQNKAQLIEQLKAEGKFVCFVGDGINDSIALKASHVSISLRGGSTVAKDTAQAILMDEGLTQLPFLFNLSKECQRTLNTTFAAILSCTAIGITGAFFLQFGLAHTITLNLIGLTLGTMNSMRPLLTYRQESQEVPALPANTTTSNHPSTEEAVEN